FSWRGACAGAFAAVVLGVVFCGWFDYSFFEAWLGGSKWICLPVMALGFFSLLLSEEIFFGWDAAVFRLWRGVLVVAFRSVGLGGDWGGVVVFAFGRGFDGAAGAVFRFGFAVAAVGQ